MTILSDVSIRHQLARAPGRALVIRPLGEGAVRPASVDLRLGPVLLIAEPDGGHRRHHLTDDGPYRLERSAFVLAATLEHVEIPPHLVGILVGKSTRARQGLIVENAGYIDPGWSGELTLELAHLSPAPVVLTLGMWIAQLRIDTVSAPPERLYGSDATSRYQSSRGPVPARTRAPLEMVR